MVVFWNLIFTRAQIQASANFINLSKSKRIIINREMRWTFNFQRDLRGKFSLLNLPQKYFALLHHFKCSNVPPNTLAKCTNNHHTTVVWLNLKSGGEGVSSLTHLGQGVLEIVRKTKGSLFSFLLQFFTLTSPPLWASMR